MRTALALLLTALLAGCGHDPVIPEKPEVVKTQYVIKVPPANLLTIPDQVPPITITETTKQSEVARWLADIDARTTALENQIIGIGKFFKDEQTKLGQ